MSKPLSNVILFLSFLVIFTVIYMPVIQTNYLLLDDYYMSWFESPKIPNLIRGIGSAPIGRYFENYFFYIIYGSINHYQSLDYARVGRVAGIISIALLAYVLFMIFKTNRIRTAYSFIGSILICTLPGFQLYVSWLHGISKICCSVLSALVGLFLFKVVFKENSRKPLHSIMAIFLAVIFLVISFEIYQPAAMIYWTVGIIPLAMLRDDGLIKNWQARFMLYFSVGFVSLAIYFIITKIMIFVAQHASHRSEIIALAAIPGKIKWFLYYPLKNALNLWNIFGSQKLGLIVGIIIIAGFLPGLRKAVLHAVRERRLNLIWNHLQRIFFILIFILLSYLPNLAVIENWSPYRTLVSLEATICILLFISLLNINSYLESKSLLSDNLSNKVIPTLLIILTIFVVNHVHRNVRYFTELQSLDVTYVKNVIQEYGISKLPDTSRIYVRESDKPYKRGYELGQPSSDDKYHTLSVVKLALYELGIKKEIELMQVPANALLPEDNNILIIDFTKLKYFLDENLTKGS